MRNVTSFFWCTVGAKTCGRGTSVCDLVLVEVLEGRLFESLLTCKGYPEPVEGDVVNGVAELVRRTLHGPLVTQRSLLRTRTLAGRWLFDALEKGVSIRRCGHT